MPIYSENVIKAPIAETIVEEMLRSSGYQVYSFGYKSVLYNLTHSRYKVDKQFEVGKAVARMPDLLVIKDDMQYFIEVKYRKVGKLSKSDITSFHYGSIILVSPTNPQFTIAQVQLYLEDGTMHPLEEDPVISIPKDLVAQFTPLVAKYCEKR